MCARFISCLVLALGAAVSHAGQQPAPLASGTEDCVRRPATHDHGAERYLPTPPKPCHPKAKADGKAASTKARAVWDNQDRNAPKEPAGERR